MAEGDNISDKCQLYYATSGEMSACTHFMATDFCSTCQLTNYHGDFLDAFLQKRHCILLARHTVSLSTHTQLAQTIDECRTEHN